MVDILWMTLLGMWDDFERGGRVSFIFCILLLHTCLVAVVPYTFLPPPWIFLMRRNHMVSSIIMTVKRKYMKDKQTLSLLLWRRRIVVRIRKHLVLLVLLLFLLLSKEGGVVCANKKQDDGRGSLLSKQEKVASSSSGFSRWLENLIGERRRRQNSLNEKDNKNDIDKPRRRHYHPIISTVVNQVQRLVKSPIRKRGRPEEAASTTTTNNMVLAATESSSLSSSFPHPSWQWWRRKRTVQHPAAINGSIITAATHNAQVEIYSKSSVNKNDPWWLWWGRKIRRKRAQSSVDLAVIQKNPSHDEDHDSMTCEMKSSESFPPSPPNWQWWRRRKRKSIVTVTQSNGIDEAIQNVKDEASTVSAAATTTTHFFNKKGTWRWWWWKEKHPKKSRFEKRKKKGENKNHESSSSFGVATKTVKTANTQNNNMNENTDHTDHYHHHDDDEDKLHHHHDHDELDDDDDHDAVGARGHARLLQCLSGSGGGSVNSSSNDDQRVVQRRRRPWWRRWNQGRGGKLQQRLKKQLKSLLPRGLRQRHRRRRKAHVRMAYRMAVLSSLAYWEFYKRPWPENHEYGFRLSSSKKEQQQKEQQRGSKNKLKQWLYCRVVDSTIVAGAKNMIGLVNDHYQQRPNNKETTATATMSSAYCHTNNNDSTTVDKDDDNDLCLTRLEYYFHNWHEPTAVGANWHDTDLLVATTTTTTTNNTPHAKNKNKKSTATSSSSLVLSFSGTSSPADALTDIQTFEPVQHSGLFTNINNSNNIIGSVHRGFLNAYSRVKNGSVLRLCHDESSSSTNSNNNNKCSVTDDDDDRNSLIQSLHDRYGHCSVIVSSTTSKKDGTGETKASDDSIKVQEDNASVAKTATTLPVAPYNNETDRKCNNSQDDSKQQQSLPPRGGEQQAQFFQHTVMKRRKNGSCRHYEQDHNANLMDVLRELITNALDNGRAVHVTGHSLGGGLAIILVLDIILNFPNVPIDQLHLWTFGAPQVVDDVFLASAMQACPRLESYIRSANGHEKNRRRDSSDNGGGRLHRFVTLTNDCEMDFVSTIASQALSPPPHTSLDKATIRQQQQEQQQQQQQPQTTDKKPKGDLRANLARRLGGVRGSIVHVAEPYYLLPPSRQLQLQQQQYRQSTTNTTTTTTNGITSSSGNNRNASNNNSNSDQTLSSQQDVPPPLSLPSSNSAVEIHRTANYLHGISQESMDHPLMSDLPLIVQNHIGEYNRNQLLA